MGLHARSLFTKALLVFLLSSNGCDLLGDTGTSKGKSQKKAASKDDDESDEKSSKKSKTKNDDEDDDTSEKKKKKKKGNDEPKKKPADEAKKENAIAEVASGPKLRLLAAQGNQIWWWSEKGIHSLQLPDTSLKVVPISDAVMVAAGPGGMAWVEPDAACKSGGACKWSVFGQVGIGDSAKKLASMEPDSIKGLHVIGGDVFVLSSGPVGAQQPKDGTITSFQIASGKRTLIASGRGTMLGWCAADATHVYFTEYTDKGGFGRRVPRGGGAVDAFQAKVLGVPLLSDASFYGYDDSGPTKVAKVGGKVDKIAGIGEMTPIALDGDTVLAREKDTIFRLNGSTPETIVVSPNGVWRSAVAGKTLVWESSEKDPAESSKVTILRVALP